MKFIFYKFLKNNALVLMNRDSSVSEWLRSARPGLETQSRQGFYFSPLFHIRLPTLQFTFTTATDASLSGLKQAEL
jgi:hypothetical protein